MRLYAMRLLTELTAILCLLIVVSPRECEAQGPNRIQEIVVKTNMESSRNSEGIKMLVKNLCGLEVGAAISKENISNAIETLWKVQIFSDISVSREPVENGFRVVILVDVLPTINSYELEGFDEFKNEEIVTALKLSNKGAIGERKIVSWKNRILDLYHEKGFMMAVVEIDMTPTVEDSTKVDLKIKITEGKNQFSDVANYVMSLYMVVSKLQGDKITAYFLNLEPVVVPQNGEFLLEWASTKGNGFCHMKSDPQFRPGTAIRYIPKTVSSYIDLEGYTARNPNGSELIRNVTENIEFTIRCLEDNDVVYDILSTTVGLPENADPYADEDGDGIENFADNCWDISNPGQQDSDNDDIGDVCDLTPYPNEAPEITIVSSDPMNVFVGTIFTYPSANVSDDKDSEEFLLSTLTQRWMPSSPLVDGKIGEGLSGSYQLTYTIRDSSGAEGSASIRVVIQ